MLIRWPGSVTAGTICDVPVTSTDFYPTILEMAGLEFIPGQHMDGFSLVPLMKGKVFPDDRPIYWHYPHYSNQGGKPGAAIRRGNFKLIEFFEDYHVELYDLSTDPGEHKNLAETMPEMTGELLDLLHAWQVEVGAEGMDPNPDYDPNYIREN
jgi:arylsulfatase A